MKLFAIYIAHKDGRKVTHLADGRDLSSWGYFKRSGVGEVMDFFSNTLVERTAAGSRQSIEEDNYVGHVHARHDGMTAVIIADQEYPSRVCFTLISKAVDEYLKRHPKDGWGASTPARERDEASLKALVAKAQEPTEIDALSKVQADLDETKGILHKTMESLLDRGEKLDDLVSKSDQLSGSSKMFYKQAKKTNSCCVIS